MPDSAYSRAPATTRRLVAWWVLVLGALGLTGGVVAWLEPDTERAAVTLVLLAWLLFLLAILFVVTVASFERTRDRG